MSILSLRRFGARPVLILLFLLPSIVAALALMPGGGEAATTERASLDSAGAQVNSGSYTPSISADGRYVAFTSGATDLVAGDTNATEDIFVRDRQAGTTERVSVDSAGGQASGPYGGNSPSISADGRYVAFHSLATNLVAGDTNGYADILVHDRQSGTTERVSVDSAEAQANGDNFYPSISSDGRYVGFISYATNLVAGDTNDVAEVFLRDRQAGATERVSVDSAGGQASGPYGSYSPSISADGRYVAFTAGFTNLVPGDTNGVPDVFVRDRSMGTTERASLDSAGAQVNGGGNSPSISADGRYIAFTSGATDLVAGDTNGRGDIFVRDRQAGMTERVSLDSTGGQATGSINGSNTPSISSDGRYVTFLSYATNLVDDDTNGVPDVFLRDRLMGTTERISVDSGGGQANDSSAYPSVSADGRHVAFSSFATNLVAGDNNGAVDIFVRSLTTPTPSPTPTPTPTSTLSPTPNPTGPPFGPVGGEVEIVTR